MTQIHNSDLTKELARIAGIQTSKDSVPNQIADKVVPVIDVNPAHSRVINIVRRAVSATTIYTTPTDRDFYLTGTHITACSTVAGSNAAIITATPKDEPAVAINVVRLFNSVAIDGDSGTSNQMYPIPIKLARGSSIVSSSGGTINQAQYTIFGYIVDTSNA